MPPRTEHPEMKWRMKYPFDMTIANEDIHKAIDFLSYKAPEKMADAKERRIIAEGFVKSLYSELFLNAEGNNEERKAKALNDEGYKNALKSLAAASREEELTKRQIDANNMQIEVWRTNAADRRATKI